MEEELNNVSEQTNVADNVDYIEALKEMKENTVSKEQYQKVCEEKKQLLKSLVNGEKIEQPEEEKMPLLDLNKKLFTQDLNNLEFIKTALELRERTLEETGKDIFLPEGKNIAPSQEDYQCAEKVASVFQQCVDIADGDSNVFTNELQRRTVDSAPFNLKKFNKR